MFKAPLLGIIATLGLAAQANAAPVLLDSYLHSYGTNAGHLDPAGSDFVGPDYVQVSDGSTQRFSDAFNFSALDYDTISSFNLTLTFRDAGPSVFPAELWAVRVQGANPASALDDLFALLTGNSWTQQITTVNAATDLFTVNAFAHTLATETFSFWFSEFTSGRDKFTLASAKLDVYGTAPVPLPAGGLMLVGALGGLAAVRRRKAN
ncbi:MAG: VPLPA-CTERM sorting domain-containing protein [Microgenomates group bacterium]